ncbi:MAG: hypothetical protein US11_C0002G0042 [Candidatus Roizmanbacteria bacterium GW2011_GWA2_36_23]|uniref:Glycosyltransferase RgtA/B/C/D-like domain-containing protein n=1 Tax=Candidatus Roizmanbacteria bacterium GW2011_GWA2_36_23 TaxID=1618480 RepID=A0A0G0E500_9BACT|nr:MAG: hypothetical protein US11_C0002G0042 [Candidatus Roizmanbacteria bacterium GW2011_GWA2_36_23]
MNKKIAVILLVLFSAISLTLNLIGYNKIPPCFNADEAAYGYNAYSLLKTGKDEYGALLPTRLKSFEDYKLPIYSYLSIPFVKIFGLNEFSTRFLNTVIATLFVPLIFLVAYELFANLKIGLVAGLLTSLSTWIHIMSRQAQEGVICAFLILLATWFLIRFRKTKNHIDFFLTNLFIFLSTFAYHFARIFLVFFIAYQLFLIIKNRKDHPKGGFIKDFVIKAFILIFIFIIPFIIDYRYSVNRVANLVFYKNEGFGLRIKEYLVEHNQKIFHNEIFESVRDISYRYLQQLSPDFFIIWGDKTWRFGYKHLGIITPLEYIFIFIGFYYLFKNKEKHRWLITLLFFVSPLGNALTWQEYSLIRTYFIFFPIAVLVSYGLYHTISQVKHNRNKYLFAFGLTVFYLFFLINNWDIYLLHYPKRIEIIRAWQCGYKEMSDYIKINYDNYDKFVITERYGQPYIFVLFYTQYDPARYQKQAKISAPDKFGFGQIGKFDKYEFKFIFDPEAKKTVYIGYPEDFNGLAIDKSKIKKIQIRSEEIFWIYEKE